MNKPGCKPRLSARAAAALALALCLVLGLSACGGGGTRDAMASSGLSGGGTTGSAPGKLQIVTTNVPQAVPGEAYASVRLQADGATGPLVWTIAQGSLPPGLTLSRDGVVSGTPNTPGLYRFTAQASDGQQADTQDYALAVGQLALVALDGLQFGDAWSGRPVRLSTGGQGGVTFHVVGNGSAGRLVQVDGVQGTALWIPGPVGPAGTLDVLRVLDPTTGVSATVDLSVRHDPTEHHVARFMQSDVWWLDWDIKRGAHPYASDFQAALALLGLRAPTSTDRLGTEADRAAELATKLALLRQFNPLFLRQRDGSAGVTGLAISVPLERPGEGYVTPGAGGWMAGRSTGYSVMALCEPSALTGAYGMAFIDAPGNPNQEHNAPGPAGDLGVFCGSVAEAVSRNYMLYGGVLAQAPVNATDLEALKAIVLDVPHVGARHALLRYQVNALGLSLAVLCAHEIGHSLGLAHNGAYVSGEVMNTTAVLAPGIEYHFSAAALSQLRSALPGPARGGAGSLAKISDPNGIALALPEGGVHVCGACAASQ